jgi:putative transposase
VNPAGQQVRADDTSRDYLPRLPEAYYQGDSVVHWTLCIGNRSTGWLTEVFHVRFREIMVHAAKRQQFVCPVYCLMPDHIHLIWMGLEPATNQRRGMKFFREHVGPFLRPYHFQHQAYDHVLREKERRKNAFETVCRYIIANPVRANLVSEAGHWAFSGCVIPGYPTLHPQQTEFWPRFWKLYLTARSPAASIARPQVT